jgi:hypothetical protein
VRGSGRSSPGSARATETTDATADAHGPDLIPPGDSEEFDRVVASFGETTGPDALRAAAADLTLTADELARIERLASLLKPTPRALKRFANVYVLLKSLGRGRGWPVPEEGRIALLVALAMGMPELTTALHALLGPGQPTLRPGALPARLHSAAVARQRERLDRWLSEHPEWKEVDLQGLGQWVEPILRFTFARVEHEPDAAPMEAACQRRRQADVQLGLRRFAQPATPGTDVVEELRGHPRRVVGERVVQNLAQIVDLSVQPDRHRCLVKVVAHRAQHEEAVMNLPIRDGIDLQIFGADQDHRQTVPSRQKQTVPTASGSGIWGLEQRRSGMLDGWIR